jgi:hypothetical protein
MLYSKEKLFALAVGRASFRGQKSGGLGWFFCSESRALNQGIDKTGLLSGGSRGDPFPGSFSSMKLWNF